MCGIAGLIGEIDPDSGEQIVALMLDAQFHRGPDSAGVKTIRARDGVVCLGSRRLAIIDTSPAGAQPMTDEQSSNVLVYNGEIYNFASLRRELEASGGDFRGRSDTEVLLRAYARWGPDVLVRLVGMFAFALWDEERARLLLARDRLGIKPLYYARVDRVLVFASEVRALLASGIVQRRLGRAGLESYLAYGAVQDPVTIVDGVRAVMPAHSIFVGIDAAPKENRYWRIPFTAARTSGAAALSDSVQDVRRALRVGVTRQLVSDVPLGLFLSGGVDSSSLVAVASEVVPNLRTFSVTFGDDPEFSEGGFAKRVADRFSTHHEEIELGENDLLELLPEGLAAVDQPTYDGMNVFVVSRAAREAGVTVILSGQGGDEIFGGYETFRRIARLSRWRLARRLVGVTAGRAAARALRFNDRFAASQRLRLLAGGGDMFSAYRVMRGVYGEPLRRHLIGQSTGILADGVPHEVACRLEAEMEGLHPVDQVSLLELSLYLGNTLLRDGDVMSMSQSIEVRVPMLDDELVELVASTSGDIKLDPRTPKPLLVESLRDRLPADVYTRQKKGFTFPWVRWLHGDLAETVSRILDDPNAGERLGIRRGASREIWRSFSERRRVVTWPMVWSLYVLLEWCERHGVSA